MRLNFLSFMLRGFTLVEALVALGILALLAGLLLGLVSRLQRDARGLEKTGPGSGGSPSRARRSITGITIWTHSRCCARPIIESVGDTRCSAWLTVR
jgi:prepilin-type N-terminal cleavage/methylation domain-containing protein